MRLFLRQGERSFGIGLRFGLDRLIEKNVGLIFVVSEVLLAEYLTQVSDFFMSD